MKQRGEVGEGDIPPDSDDVIPHRVTLTLVILPFKQQPSSTNRLSTGLDSDIRDNKGLIHIHTPLHHQHPIPIDSQMHQCQRYRLTWLIHTPTKQTITSIH